VHIFHDERSASFAALGIGLQSGSPAVLLCTSGTAATHFHGAVAEADLSNVPMIVCTADRPPELLDVGAPQTINQSHLYGSMVRWFHDPGVASHDAQHTWRSLAARSVRASLSERAGPVHLNLPFREPLLGEVGTLPEARESAWSSSVVGSLLPADVVQNCAQQISHRKGIIVAGRGATESVFALASKLGWPILADARSGAREDRIGVVLSFDAILRSSNFADSHVPEVVIRVGEPPASKVTNQWIAASGAYIVQIQQHNKVIDPDHLVSQHLIGDVDSTIRHLAEHASSLPTDWLSDWVRAETNAQLAIDAWTSKHESEPTNARVLTQSLPAHSNFVISSSMPIRDIEWFGSYTPAVAVYSNRGANGIDGVTSTAVGVALASGAPTFVYIGDVAALHDANGLLGLVSRDADVKVVVSNNDGGSIFSFLPQAAQVDAKIFELLYGTPHGASFESLAAAYGVPYNRVNSSDDLRKAMLMSGSRVIEIITDRTKNVSAHNALNDAIVVAINSSMA
jgi:2-succinyl-5-enolpyruvyl-6-hydroxy-3-cyclohexene-1-carboxylate synthase